MAPPTFLNAVRDLDRLRQIVAVLVRHGFGEIVGRTGLGSLASGKAETRVNQSVGERVRLVIQDLGPSFIKLGQIVSTRPDLIPADVISELKKLQDQVAPVAFEQIKTQIEAELGSPLEQLFEVFDPEPLASASVGQVHRARLRTEDGVLREVAIKVQRPGIKAIIERDLDLLYLLAQALERSIPDARLYSPVRLVSEFDRAITAELDFQLEADHAVRFRKNFENHPEVHFPKIYRKWSGKRVLALEFLSGQKVYAAIESGFDAEKITRATLGVMIKSIFEDGFFHADPHPGNIIIMGQPDAPVIGLIDLGLVGRLTPQLRDKTIDLMIAAVEENHRGIADALYAIGTPTRKVDRAAFESEVTMLAERYLGKPLGEIEISSLIRDLVGGATKFGLEIPPDFLMVGKTLMTVEGVGREIAPTFDLYGEMKPYFVRLVANRYAPDRMLPELLRNVSRISHATTNFPVQAQEILEDLRQGRLEVRTREPSLSGAADVIGRRIYSGFVVGSFVLGSAWLIASERLPEGILFFVVALGWNSGHSLLTMWRSRKKR